jgi:hypothetical protein
MLKNPTFLKTRAAVVSAAFLAFVGVLTIGGLPAAAQSPQCGARAAVLDRLSDKFGEQPVSIGVTATGSLLEVLASPEGSWTIVVTVPNGPTCLVSSGDGWHNAPVQIAQEPRV